MRIEDLGPRAPIVIPQQFDQRLHPDKITSLGQHIQGNSEGKLVWEHMQFYPEIQSDRHFLLSGGVPWHLHQTLTWRGTETNYVVSSVKRSPSNGLHFDGITLSTHGSEINPSSAPLKILLYPQADSSLLGLIDSFYRSKLPLKEIDGALLELQLAIPELVIDKSSVNQDSRHLVYAYNGQDFELNDQGLYIQRTEETIIAGKRLYHIQIVTSAITNDLAALSGMLREVVNRIDRSNIQLAELERQIRSILNITVFAI